MLSAEKNGGCQLELMSRPKNHPQLSTLHTHTEIPKIQPLKKSEKI